MRLATLGSLGAVAAAAHAALNARLLRQPGNWPPPCRERVSVLVPARDEAERIGPCIAALLAQQGVDFQVLVLDDGSTDGTAEVVRAAAAGDPRITVLPGAPLAAGWLGKPHACAQLAAAATGSVLVFVDADVVLAPHALAACAALLRDAGLDLVSPYPQQLADFPAARLVQPLLQWSWLTFLPLRAAERSAAPSLSAANGQLLVVDAEAYRRCGGHAAVHDQVLEDVALARAAKSAGLRVAMAEGAAVATCRMYTDWAGLRDGYTKSLWAAFGSPTGAVWAAGLLALLYLVPPAAAAAALVRRRPGDAVVPALGTAAGVLGRVVVAKRTGGRPADALAHPASIALLLWLLLRSTRARRNGTLSWKGRALPARAQVAAGGRACR